MSQPISRRGVLASGVLTAAAAAAAAPLAVSQTRGYDPRSTAEGQIKLLAALDGSPAYWAYSGVIYAVLPHQRPRPILGLAGGQASWAAPRADGAYDVGGAVLTFFRDIGTGAFLTRFDNPITGKRNPVTSNVLTGGRMIYPADGSSARAVGQLKAAAVAPEGFKVSDPAKALGGVRWSVMGSKVMLMTDRSWNVAVQPQLEAQTQIADSAAFFDPKVLRMPASFTATTIIPWMSWMDMGDTPGHLVWHSSGEKLFSIDDMPADYRARAGVQLDLLTAPPAV